MGGWDRYLEIWPICMFLKGNLICWYRTSTRSFSNLCPWKLSNNVSGFLGYIFLFNMWFVIIKRIKLPFTQLTLVLLCITYSILIFHLQNSVTRTWLEFLLCRIGIDEWLRVPSVQDVFAIGDCSGFLESTGKPVLPALAQVSLLDS